MGLAFRLVSRMHRLMPRRRPNGFFLETSRLAGPPLKDLHHDWTSEGREHGSAPFRAFLAWMSDVYLGEWVCVRKFS